MTPRDGLTGLEQYSLERAGYFIRRKVLSPAAIRRLQTAGRPEDFARSVIAQVAVKSIVDDLFRDPVIVSVTVREPETARTAWGRDGEIDRSLPVEDQIAALHQLPPAYRLTLSVERDERMLVIPGSQERIIVTDVDFCAEDHGPTRIRLKGGDLLVYSSALLRCDCPGGVAGRIVEARIEPRPAPLL